MIDCTKIHSLPVLPQKLLKNDLLIFPQSNVSTEGEVLNRWQIAHFKSLEIGIKCNNKGNYSKLSGSLHKYKQDGKNWQDFNLSDIQDTIHELSETFEFDPEKAVLNFIEIGINIPMDYDPTPLINCFILYRNTPFDKMKVTGKGYGRVAYTDNFDIKVYNKSLQYGLSNHLLRFEIKVKAIKLLKRYEINGLTLSDLTRPDIYPKFKTMLLDILSGILIYNPDIEPDKLTNINDRELLKLGKFADYWQQMERRRKSEKLIRFKELAGTDKILENLKNKISEKWEFLSKPDKIHTLPKRHTPDKIHTFGEKQNIPPNAQTGQITPTINGYIVLNCSVTGLPIYNQRPGTKYISPKGIKWYFENEPETYKNKLEPLLTEKWLFRHKGEPIENHFNEIYHQIRNRALNPKNNFRRSLSNLENKGMKLFPTVELLQPEKLKLIKNEIPA